MENGRSWGEIRLSTCKVIGKGGSVGGPIKQLLGSWGRWECEKVD